MNVEMWTPWLCALPLESLLCDMTGSGVGQIRFDPKLMDPTSIPDFDILIEMKET
jgi:hypothetical protein